MDIRLAVALIMLCFRIDVHGNPGTDFILCFVQIFESNTKTDVLMITPTTDRGSVVKVIAPGYPEFVNSSFTIDAGENLIVIIDEHIAMDLGSYVDKRALHVTASDNITVVGLNQEQSRTAGSSYDTFMARPTDQLGHEYFAVTYKIEIITYQPGTTFAVVASQDSTLVKITLAKHESLSVIFENVTYSSGETITKTLQQYDVLQIQAVSDLTGSHVIANEPIAAYSGLNRTYVHNRRCRSALLDQLPPVNTWGKKYVSVTSPESEGDVYRIVARWKNTAVFVEGMDPFLLEGPGSWKEIFLKNATYISASKPIMLAQIGISQPRSTDDHVYIGDPKLLILSPVDTGSSNYTFSTLGDRKWFFFVVIVIRTATANGLLLNNEDVKNVANVSVEHAQELLYTVLSVNLTGFPSPLNLAHRDGAVFQAYVYSAVKCEAMANSLGAVPSTMYQECEQTTGYPGDGLDNDCDGLIDEEACCVNLDSKDDDGDLIVDEDCSAPPGDRSLQSIYHICCGENNIKYFCNEIIQNKHYNKSDNVRMQSTNITSRKALTKLGCFEECGKSKGCWGVNFSPFAPSGGDNCDTLYGTPTAETSNNEWIHYVLQKTWFNYMAV